MRIVVGSSGYDRRYGRRTRHVQVGRCQVVLIFEQLVGGGGVHASACQCHCHQRLRRRPVWLLGGQRHRIIGTAARRYRQFFSFYRLQYEKRHYNHLKCHIYLSLILHFCDSADEKLSGSYLHSQNGIRSKNKEHFKPSKTQENTNKIIK